MTQAQTWTVLTSNTNNTHSNSLLRTHNNEGFQGVCSGSLCFGGMEKLHHNTSALLKEIIAWEFGL